MVSSSPRSKLGRQISRASSFAGVSPVAHSSSESSCCVFSLFAISRSLLRFTPWSSPCRSLTSRARGSSRAASSARRSPTTSVITESVIGAGPGDRDELAQHVKVYVVEFLHVDAAGTLRVLTQLGEQGGSFWQVLEPVDRQLRLARGEPDLRPVADPARVRR